MEWEKEAEQLLARAPIFVRPWARRKIEEFARARSLTRITGDLAQQAYASLRGGETAPSPELVGQLESEAEAFARRPELRTRHFTVQPCAGAVGCPRSLIPVKEIAEALTHDLAGSGFPEFLEQGLQGRPLLSHHRFQVAVSGCPNACSQPQIRDFGLIGAREVKIEAFRCSGCLKCTRACREGALTVKGKTPQVDTARCLGCGDCVRACPTDALSFGAPASRLLLGGKLGRHPRLADEVARADSLDAILAWQHRVLDALMRHGQAGERVGALLEREGTGLVMGE